MKKFQLTALLTVCAMVGVMVFGIVPGVYAEEVQPIKIEGESISMTGGKTVSVNGLSDSKALEIVASTSANSTASYTVPNVEKAGLYTMKVVSSRQGPRYASDVGGVQFVSPYWVQVNEEAPFTFTEGSAYDKYGYGKGVILINPDFSKVTAGGGVVQYTTYEIPVYLHAGDNTVKFIVKDTRQNPLDAKAVLYLDCIEFTYQSSGAANLPVLIQGEEYADTNVPEAGVSEITDSALNNGAALKISTAERIPADGFYVDYTATVAKEGMYTLEFASSIQGYETADEGSNANCEAASPYTVKVNDGNAVAFRDFSGYRRSEKTVGDMKLVTYAMDVHLNRGVNTVRFAAAKGCVNDNTVMFALDYLKLSPLMHYFAEDFKVEGESFSKASVAYAANNCCVRDNIGLSNNKDAYFCITDSAPTLDYEFYVEKAGNYAIYTASAMDNNAWASDVDISVNDAEYITVDSTTSEKLSSIKPAKNGDLYAINAIKTTLVPLKKGYNTMKIKAHNLTTVEPIRYLLAVDYVRFVKAGTSVTQDATYANYKAAGMNNFGGFRFRNLQNQTFVPELFTEGDLKGGTSYVKHSFFVGETSDYALTIIAGANIGGSNPWESESAISFDDQEATKLTADNAEFSAKRGSLADNAVAYWTYKPAVPLSAGWHTLKFESLGPAEKQGSNTFIYWQGFTLEEVAGADTAALSFADPVITVGESTQAKITYLSAAGDEVTPEENAVSYTSSNTNVAEVDSDGKVTAFNPGKTVITACNDAVEIAGAELIVLPEGSTVFAQEVRRDNTNKTINVRVSSIGDMQADEEVSVIVASYATEEGLPTTLKSVSVNKVSGLKNGINQDIPVQIEDLQASDTVNLYIWRSMGELVPLWTKDEVIVNN